MKQSLGNECSMNIISCTMLTYTGKTITIVLSQRLILIPYSPENTSWNLNQWNKIDVVLFLIMYIYIIKLNI